MNVRDGDNSLLSNSIRKGGRIKVKRVYAWMELLQKWVRGNLIRNMHGDATDPETGITSIH